MAIRADAHLDEFHRDQQWHKPCRVATTANITISTALNNGDAIDGVTLATGDRVLVKDQSTGSQNGIYIVGASPARAYDMLAGIQAMGAFVYILAGTANGGKLFKNTNTTLPTIGTTALTFTEFTSGIAGITISDEGTPLATAATSIDFVGAGVTATGAGATKTITIPGGASFATPAIVLGTAAAAGAASTVIRSDSTIVAFDATVPTTQAFGDAAATGSAAVASRRDHVHGMPAASGVGELLISDTPSTPLIFADLIQNEAQDDLVYADP